jgi:hypothetical protein
VKADRASRTKALWSGAATVAVLALVLIGLGLLGPLRGKQPSSQNPITLSTQTATSQGLYQQAVQAQASGDLTRAAQLAQAALEADPNNSEAKVLLRAVKNTNAGSTTTSTTPTSSSATTPAADPDAVFRKKYENLMSLLPTGTPGFAFDPAMQFGPDITMSGNRVPGVRGTTQIAWAVHDMKTSAAAKSFVTKTSKKLFQKDAGSVTVHGVKRYFGTDGTRFATVSFARGRYAFEVLITVNGIDPKTVKAVASEAANAFPESPHQ